MGIKPVVVALMHGLNDERNVYRKTIGEKMSSENITAMAAQNEEVDKTMKFVFGSLGMV